MNVLKKSALALAASSLLALQAHAQWVVIDPTNLVQNMLTAARALQQINNQIRQLQNEAQMLANDARNLTSLDFSALAELRATLAATNELIARAEGLAFTVSHTQSEFARLYPAAYSATVSGSRMAADARQRWDNALEALRTATIVQSQAVQNFASDERTLGDLVSRSQSAAGALQAMQATNQLLALQSRQAIQGQQLQLTQDRAAAMEQARQAGVQARAVEVRRRFQGSGSSYTPHAVNFYGH
jgi:P-type conjugative transfer protein TrbJ